MIARVVAVAALAVAIVVVALVVLGGGSSYTLKADFQDAGGLVTGNDVLMGPAKVGSVQSISLTADTGPFGSFAVWLDGHYLGSATTPTPAYRRALLARTSAERTATAHSPSPRLSIHPTGPE